MSESWTQCPRCWAKLADKCNELKQKVENEYGKISKEKYMELVEESRTAIKATHSLGENYEIGMGKDGSFSIGYKCRCTSCGFFFAFEHTVQAKIYKHA